MGVLGASAVWVSKGKMDNSEHLEAKEEWIKPKIIEEEIVLDLKEENVKINRSNNKKDKKKELSKNEIAKQTERKEIAKKNEADKQIEIQKQAELNLKKNQEEEQQAEAVASSQVKVKKVKLKQPVEGRIYKDFANDKLVYSKTLEEWSVHLGIDIAAKEGTDVKAAYDGIVKSVENNGKLGITIVIDHGSGLETVYKNISTEKMVEIGQKVKAGDVISKVSKGMGFEKLDEAHLHFEVLESGTGVDPKGFF